MDSLPNTRNIADFTNKVFHADCLDLLAALPDKSVDLILTDPPYGTTAAFWEATLDLVSLANELFRIIKPKGAVISTAAQPFTSELVTAWRKYFQYEWIWRKAMATNFLNAKIMPLVQHESILVFGHRKPNYYPQKKKGKLQSKGTGQTGSEVYREIEGLSYFSDTYYPKSVLDFNHDPEKNITFSHLPSKAERHPTQKPLMLWEYLMLTYSEAGDIVLDPFAGSATTAIACLNLDRQYICSDSHLPYVEMSRQRIASHDPFVDTPLKNGLVQKSLFASAEGEGA